jgi:8-oxo-dGTP diphosphatase
MRKAVRAIVIKDDHLLLMHRNRFGQEYYILAGGGIDPNETAEQALLREIKEETNLTVKNPELVFVEYAGDPFGIQYIYLCEYESGEVGLQPTSEEAAINKLGQNLYSSLWLPIAKFPDVAFVSDALKHAILDALKSGFPKEPVAIKPTPFVY